MAITTWINGCERISIQPKEIKDGKPVENSTFDVEQLELVERAKQLEPMSRTGGDRQSVTRSADVK